MLVDNGSTDDSSEIARRTCKALNLAHTLILEPCPGKVHALRAGLAQVRTRFVATFDADTLLSAALPARGRQAARTGPVVAVVGAYFTHASQWARRDAFTGVHIVAAGKLLSHQCHAGGAGQVFNTEVLRRAGGFDANRWNLGAGGSVRSSTASASMARWPMAWTSIAIPRRVRATGQSIRWTLYERLRYHFASRKNQGRFFYDFLGGRLRERKLSSERIRERQFQSEPAPDAGKCRALVVCADDFGLTSAISRSIVALAGQGKLNAISCMSVCPGWKRDAALLALLPKSVQIGLHVTLTEEEPLTAMPVLAWNGRMPASSELEKRALVRRLPLGEIRKEVAAQFERFIDVVGRPPDFVGRAPACPCAARHPRDHHGRDGAPCAQSMGAQLRRSALGDPVALLPGEGDDQQRAVARGARAAAASHGLACNDSFAGFYDFSGDYRALFPQFLEKPGQFHLIMCHPGGGHANADTIARARRRKRPHCARCPFMRWRRHADCTSRPQCQ